MLKSSATRRSSAFSGSNNGTENSVSLKPVELHEQQQIIYNELGRRNLLRCGRRFGKTTLLETTFLGRAQRGRKVGWFTPDYKLMRPTYTRMLRIAGPAVVHASRTESIIEMVGGGLIEFWTLDNPDAGRSRDYDDVVIDEASLKAEGLREIIEQAITPTLLDRGGTITMAGTPKGVDPANFFYLVGTHPDEYGYRTWHAPSWLNPNLSAEEVANLEKNNPPLVYQQEYCAEFVDWSGAAFFSIDSMTVDGRPVEPPVIVDAIVATIDTAIKAGKENDGTAVIWSAYQRYPEPRLWILDWDIIQVEGAMLELWLPGVMDKGRDFAKQYRARLGLGCWIEDKGSGSILLQQAKRRNMPVNAIDSKLTDVGKEGRAINVSGYVYRGWVKLTPTAFNKTVNYKGDQANHFRRQVVGFRVGNKEQTEDDLLDCFTYNVALTCGNSEGF